MEKDFGSGYDQHLLSSTLNLSGFRFNSNYTEDSTLRNLPSIPHSSFQQPKASEPNRLQNWFYHNHKQHFHHAFAPVPNSATEQKLPEGLSGFGQPRSPQKRFLVFDQSGDKTTLLYTSGVHGPVNFGARREPNLPTPGKVEPKDSYLPSRLSLKEENVEENSRDLTEGEMHENTEELDALLCSDYDSDFSEDEETSTGHSPSTMTDNGSPKVEETGEEVDSFCLPIKRRKLDSPNSLKILACSELESDAESSCGSRSNQLNEELHHCKRSKRDKVAETVRILQSIIPDSNGKDAIVVIDEAIHYLRSLKAEAKALGLDTV